MVAGAFAILHLPKLVQGTPMIFARGHDGPVRRHRPRQ